MFLTPDDLIALTKRTQRAAQIRVLRAMAIEHRIHPDGSAVVLRSHVEGLLGGAPGTKVEAEERPDWEALARVTKAS